MAWEGERDEFQTCLKLSAMLFVILPVAGLGQTVEAVPANTSIDFAPADIVSRMATSPNCDTAAAAAAIRLVRRMACIAICLPKNRRIDAFNLTLELSGQIMYAEKWTGLDREEIDTECLPPAAYCSFRDPGPIALPKRAPAARV